MLIPVILSGGAGSRLWPVSREAHPKPFMVLPDGRSLLQATVERATALDDVSSVLTITNREHYFKTRDCYSASTPPRPIEFDYVLEPVGRNTAPAIIAAAMRLQAKYGDDACLLVMAADHLISKQDAFQEAVSKAYAAAKAGYLVTFGIKPTCPETGYGYIETGVAIDDLDANTVIKFVEKPDQATAASYLASGKFLWNSGMFCLRAGTLLEAAKECAAEMSAQVEAVWSKTDLDAMPVELDAESFAEVADDSIDYAIMERASKVAVVPADLGWSDIGSWDAVSDLLEKDDAGNCTQGEAYLVDASNCYVQTQDRLVAAVGVDDLLIIDTDDAVLVADRKSAQKVKEVVKRLKAEGHEAYRWHRTVHRPWGTYTVLEEGERFKIKRIVVKPGASLSLQMHHHRSEHWVVVSGTAMVVNGDREIMVRTNESTYIPIGNKHRLVNPGVLDLVMIEVQSGDYLGEDDIVRFEDNYGRS